MANLTYRQIRELTDDAVMAQLAAGHGDAAAVLFDRYSRLVLSIANKVVTDRAEAEDLTQEIFVELCRTAAQFDAAKGTAKMWIIRTAYRRSLNRRRHLKFRESVVRSDLSFEEILEAPPALGLAPFPGLATEESRRFVSELLGALESPQRRVLEMVHLEGASMRDVAARTGDTLESVRHRYYRGMRRLRELALREEHGPVPSAMTKTRETASAKA